MEKVKSLLVIFENQIKPSLVSAFRGAIIAKVGTENVAFHNHGAKKLIYQYPCIQYKVISEKASLFCVGNGVDEIHNLFGLRNWDIQLHGQELVLKIHRLDLNTISLDVWDKIFPYQIRNWLALNGDNFKKYQQINGLAERIQFLERLLAGNILSFAKGVGWHIDKPIKIQIQELKKEKIIRYKGVPLMAFDVNFGCNVFLPNYLGLGKSASHGFGIIYQNKNSK